MAVKIRLQRGGAKKRPFYSVVVADKRYARDGKFLEKLGTYNPLLPKDSTERFKISQERAEFWLKQGAEPSEKVASLIAKAGFGTSITTMKNVLKRKDVSIKSRKAAAEAKAKAEEAKKKAEEAAAAAAAAEQPAA